MGIAISDIRDFQARRSELRTIGEFKEIWLLHCSLSNSDTERFKTEVRQITGKPTYVAQQ